MTVPQLRRSSLHLFLHSVVSIHKVHVHCIYQFILIFPRYITNQLNEQLPVGLQNAATSFPALFPLSPSYFISEKALGTRLTALHRCRWGQSSDHSKTEFFLSSIRNWVSYSLWTADAFPVVASLPPKGREATTGNASAVRRLGKLLAMIFFAFISSSRGPKKWNSYVHDFNNFKNWQTRDYDALIRHPRPSPLPPLLSFHLYSF